MNVNNAFLQGDLEEEVYMEIPQGCSQSNAISVGKKKVCMLLKSLYGLKQASKQWNIKFTESLVSNGYEQNKHDYSLSSKQNQSKQVHFLIYVDNLLITGPDEHMICQLKHVLHSHFKLKVMRELRYLLVIEVAQSKEGMVINQQKYALELIEDVDLLKAKPSFTPMEINTKMTILSLMRIFNLILMTTW